ncbi:MAG: TonB-dependent receptor, partial [Acidobacteriaceae bacterium]|nr:TonB-dependent receptor [Acidobacteriaceae bacterium]
MTLRQWTIAALAAITCVIGLSTTARAQSSITGSAKDTSGAILPGVTVEVASDALIEKTREVITDDQGAYRIVDLRPGTYTVTFALPGFQTYKREGLELPANFTATINAVMSVGQFEEALTVSGQSPVVDVNTNVKAQVLPRDVLDAVPTARTIQSIGQLVVGVQLSSPDVGGSRAMQQTYFAVHGSGGAQTVVTVDGLMTNGLMGDGSVQAYHNEAMVQEAVYQTAGGTAETMTGGVNMNLVPKEGGNRFSGGAKASKSPSSWQGNNLTPRLINLGISGVDSIANFYEWNAEEGGPLVKDTLWFFGAFRHATYDKPIANTFYTPANMSFPAGFAYCTANIGACQQGVSDEKMDNPIVRLTWQASPRNKFSAYMDRALRLRGHAMGAGTDPLTASVVWHTPTFATGSFKWSSPITSRLLVEAGTAFNRERYDNVYQNGIAQTPGTPAWYAGARNSDTASGITWGAAGAQLGNYPDRYSTTGAASYVTGTHNVKVGAQFSKGTYKRWQDANADLYQTYNNGVPATVTVLNSPVTPGERLNGSLGLYAQDSWHVGKLTMNYGLRWDYLKQSVMGQPAQNGRFVSTPAYGDITMPIWNDWSPRLSAVYDLFGNGKTAVRAGFNKFVTAGTTGAAATVNPSGLTSATIRWVDVNGDGIAQGELGCNFGTNGNPGCEINTAQLPANFGQLQYSVIDPNLKRPYQYATNIGISHEVMNGLAITAEWIHSDFKNMVTRAYTQRDANSYTPVNVVSPLNGQVFTVYNVK